ncbi:putative oxidase/peroxidase [Operophtera brumata]|uniref:Putative oxidase/peroxidase n=1 Tax=Operophtera brumata TaxID=104452 RepID=A0A0L7L1R1_OPEBR|nr:putative oxidase/peroxidase [Operophtera brumata]
MPVAISGRPLPNARVLSTRLFYDRSVSSQVMTHMNMQWGQFVTHDIVFQVMEVTDEGGIQCCMGNGKDVLPTELMNDKCIPICVPDDDPFYKPHGIRCLNFVRSVTTPRDDCSLGYAEQMNTVTSFLDGSQIYGSDKILASKLRSKKGGRLRQDPKKGCSKKGYLPSVEDNEEVNPGVINSFGAAAFRFLHSIVPESVMQLPAQLSDHYFNPSLLESTPESFDDMLRGITTLPSPESDPHMTQQITNLLFKSHNKWGMDLIAMDIQRGRDHGLASYNDYRLCIDMLRGITTLPCPESDPHMTQQITNLLFKSHNKWDMDLIAMDIQRGRDHGLASYNDYRY